METYPMGRGMLKIMHFFGLEPQKKSAVTLNYAYWRIQEMQKLGERK